MFEIISHRFGQTPGKAIARVTVGDTWNQLLFSATDLDADGNEFPANLTGRTYALQVRPVGSASVTFMNLTAEDFVLGQSAEALQYDIDRAKPPGTTFDQLFIWAKPEQTRMTHGEWEFDLQETGPGDDITTLYRGPYFAEGNVTRG